MAMERDILITTTQNIEGYTILKYLKPIASHVVAGTNIFSDLLAGLTDLFGGRSGTYEKQLKSLYNEVIEKIKLYAYELGANAVIGLSIDMDEIFGKNMAMFMITANGTAVITEKNNDNITVKKETLNISLENMNILKKKIEILKLAEQNKLSLDNENWEFVIYNNVPEIFGFLMKKYLEPKELNEYETVIFNKYFPKYINSLKDTVKIKSIYDQINEENIRRLDKITDLISGLNLFDAKRCIEILKHENFEIQKTGIKIATFNKEFYNKEDIPELENIYSFIKNNFGIRGKQSTKKQMFSSKEKEIWICECGTTNEVGNSCNHCGNDIYGFKISETKPSNALDNIMEKINLIKSLSK